MRILYVTTVSSTVNAFLIPHIKMLIEQGHQVDIAFSIDQAIKPDIREMGCEVHVLPFRRVPLRIESYQAYVMLKKIIVDGKYEIVHTHTPVASAIVRLVCINLKNITVIYTAHGFHFFEGAPIINWLVYYPIEKWLSRYTDVLITINEEDYQRAKRSFKSGRVEYIPGVGLDTKKFTNITIDKSAKRKELGLPEDAFVVLSVGELNKNKNHETIIKTLALLNDPKIYYVVCGAGSLERYLRELAVSLCISNQIKILGYRRDVIEIYNIADIFVFPSLREGLPVALMEAMAVGLPIICSNIRGNQDLIIDGEGGILVKPDDIEGYANAIRKVGISNELSEDMRTFNKEAIKKFELLYVLNKMIQFYNLGIDI